MATNQELTIEIIAQIAAVAAKAVVRALLKERRDEDEITRYRSDTTGVRPRLDRLSPLYTFTDKVKNISHTHKVSRAKKISVAKYIQDKQAISQVEHEEDNDSQMLQLCEMKRHKSENVQEWIIRLRLVAKECKYQELDRQVKENLSVALMMKTCKEKQTMRSRS